ncbi:twin-arginine translocation signal domain-containing protein [Pedobacter sp. WC2423]
MTNRRDFIKQTGLLSVAGIVGANQIAMAEKPDRIYTPNSSKMV